MKLILIFACLLSVFSAAYADDVADAKAAFATLVEYQKSDDIRSLDLFDTDCSLTFTYTNGKTSKELVTPATAFRQTLAQELAKKQGNRDTYEDVKFVQEESSVRVTAKIRYADAEKRGLDGRGDFNAVYRRDASGVLKVHELKVTVPVHTGLNS